MNLNTISLPTKAKPTKEKEGEVMMHCERWGEGQSEAWEAEGYVVVH
jgi:hypothetical protein